MSPSSRPRPTHARSLLIAVAGALVLLTACNPLVSDLPGARQVTTDATYHGAEGSWLEVSVTGAEDYDVTFYVQLLVGPTGSRSCRDAASGAVETCPQIGEYINTDTYTASATRRAVLSPADGDLMWFSFFCQQGGSEVNCPDLRVSLRTVDGDGKLAGDLG
jgi:hypothetical protein